MGSGGLIVMVSTCRCKAWDESCGKCTPLLFTNYIIHKQGKSGITKKFEPAI